jgi:hypothetical protein
MLDKFESKFEESAKTSSVLCFMTNDVVFFVSFLHMWHVAFGFIMIFSSSCRAWDEAEFCWVHNKHIRVHGLKQPQDREASDHVVKITNLVNIS